MGLVFRVPGDQRLLSFDLVKESPAPVVPVLRLSGRLDGAQCRSLRVVESVEQRALVAVPAPRRAFDPERRENPQVRIQAFELRSRQRALIGYGLFAAPALIAVHTSPYRF